MAERNSLRFVWLRFFIPIILGFFVVFFLLYRSFQNASLDSLERTNKDVLSQSNAIVSYMNDMIFNNAMQAFYDEDVVTLRNASTVSNREEVMGIRALDSFSGYSSLVYSVYIYNRRLDRFFATSNVPSDSAEQFFDRGVLDLFTSIGKEVHMRPYYRFVQKPYERGLLEVCTFFLFEPDVNGKINDFMVINVKADYLDSFLSFFVKDFDVLLLNEQDRVIGSTYQATSEEITTIEQTVMERTEESGRFIIQDGRKANIYFYDRFGSTDWCFVRSLKYEDFFMEFERMKMVAYLSLFGFVALSSLVGLVTALYFYRPLKKVALNFGDRGTDLNGNVDRLLETAKSAIVLEEGYSRHLRGEFLRQFLQRRGTPIETCNREFQAFNIFFDTDRSFYLVLFSLSSEPIRDDIGALFPYYVKTRLDTNTVVMVQDDLELRNVERIVNEHDCYAVFSKKYAFDADMALIIENLTECLSYSMFTPHNRIYYEQSLESKAQQIPYPAAVESQIIACLDKFDETGAFDAYNFFLSTLIACRLSFILFSLKRLYLSCMYTTDLLDDGVFERLELIVHNERDKKALDEVFRSLFQSRIDLKRKQKAGRGDQIASQVMDIILEEYEDFNLGIQSIADKLGFSSVYLGKIFKEARGLSVAEQINQVRLIKAKELLSLTDMPVKTIAAKAGFPSIKYFYALFRKAMNETPNDYREKIKEGKNEDPIQ